MFPWLVLIRPHQWYKNALCLVPALLVPGFLLSEGFMLFAAFCLASSAVYVFNDWMDRESDAQTEDRHKRPLACGLISSTQALVSIPLLGFGAFLLWPDGYAWTGLLLYGGINLLYNLLAKPLLGYGMTTAVLVLGCYLARTIPVFEQASVFTMQHAHLLFSLALVIFPMVVWKQRSYLLGESRWPLWLGQLGISIGVILFLPQWGMAAGVLWFVAQLSLVRIFYERNTREPYRALFRI